MPLLVEWFLISCQFKELQLNTLSSLNSLIILWTYKVPAIFGASSMPSGSLKTSHSGRYRDLIPLCYLRILQMILHQWFASFRIWRLGKLFSLLSPQHRPSDLFHDGVLLINSSNQIKNISGAKLGCASITPNVNFSSLNGFVQFFDHLHGASVCCNTLVICCIRRNRDALTDYFSVVSTKIATSREYWKCIMPKVGTLDFLLIFVAIVLAIVNMNKHFFQGYLLCYCKTCFVNV